jgi:hypothetical protein
MRHYGERQNNSNKRERIKMRARGKEIAERERSERSEAMGAVMEIGCR